MFLRVLCCAFCQFLRHVSSVFRHAFDSALYVGNPHRVRPQGEPDPDSAHLAHLNREWRRMFYGDPSMLALMTHVRFLRAMLFLVMALVIHVGTTNVDVSQLWAALLVLIFCLSIPYWIWIGIWHRRIEVRVFFEFKKRFGAYYHLH